MKGSGEVEAKVHSLLTSAADKGVYSTTSVASSTKLFTGQKPE
jgi:hypothetical protein